MYAFQRESGWCEALTTGKRTYLGVLRENIFKK